MAHLNYHEVQKMDQWWMKTLLVISALTMFGGLLMSYFQEASGLTDEQARTLLSNYLLVFIGVGVAVAGLIFLVLSHRLEIQLDDHRLRYKFFPWIAWKEVKPEDLKGFEIREAKFMWRFGGWGLRYNPFIGQWAYLIKGRYGLVLRFRSGKMLTMTTTRPQELEKAMDKFMAKKGESVNG